MFGRVIVPQVIIEEGDQSLQPDVSPGYSAITADAQGRLMVRRGSVNDPILTDTKLSNRSLFFKPDFSPQANLENPISPLKMRWNNTPVYLGPGQYRRSVTGSVRRRPHVVFKVAGRYGMIYSGSDNQSGGLQFVANLAWSDDLINWIDAPNNPILNTNSLPYQSSRVWITAMCYDDDEERWVGYVGGNAVNVAWGERASHPWYSYDLKNWTPYPNSPTVNALNPEMQSWGPPPTDRVYVNGVLKKDGQWYLFVQVGKNNGPYYSGILVSDTPNGPWQSGDWNPIFDPATIGFDNGNGIHMSQPVFADNKWWIAGNWNNKIGLFSSDKILGPWTNHGEIINSPIALSSAIMIPESDHWAILTDDRGSETGSGFLAESRGLMLFQSGVDASLIPSGSPRIGSPSGKRHPNFAYGYRCDGFGIDWGEQPSLRYLLLAKIADPASQIVGNLRGRGRTDSDRASSSVDLYINCSQGTANVGINWEFASPDGYQDLKVVECVYNQSGRTDGNENWFAIDFGNDAPRVFQHGWFDGHCTLGPNQLHFVDPAHITSVNNARARRVALWTPIIEGSATNPTITYTQNRGTYQRRGAVVDLFFEIVINTISGGTGNLRIGGLPFAPFVQQYSAVQFSEFTGVTLPANTSQVLGRVGFTGSGTAAVGKILLPCLSATGTENQIPVSGLTTGSRLSGHATMMLNYA
jgi:hypothetical protein